MNRDREFENIYQQCSSREDVAPTLKKRPSRRSLVIVAILVTALIALVLGVFGRTDAPQAPAPAKEVFDRACRLLTDSPELVSQLSAAMGDRKNVRQAVGAIEREYRARQQNVYMTLGYLDSGNFRAAYSFGENEQDSVLRSFPSGDAEILRRGDAVTFPEDTGGMLLLHVFQTYPSVQVCGKYPLVIRITGVRADYTKHPENHSGSLLLSIGIAALGILGGWHFFRRTAR